MGNDGVKVPIDLEITVINDDTIKDFGKKLKSLMSEFEASEGKLRSATGKRGQDERLKNASAIQANNIKIKSLQEEIVGYAERLKKIESGAYTIYTEKERLLKDIAFSTSVIKERTKELRAEEAKILAQEKEMDKIRGKYSQGISSNSELWREARAEALNIERQIDSLNIKGVNLEKKKADILNSEASIRAKLANEQTAENKAALSSVLQQKSAVNAKIAANRSNISILSKEKEEYENMATYYSNASGKILDEQAKELKMHQSIIDSREEEIGYIKEAISHYSSVLRFGKSEYENLKEIERSSDSASKFGERRAETEEHINRKLIEAEAHLKELVEENRKLAGSTKEVEKSTKSASDGYKRTSKSSERMGSAVKNSTAQTYYMIRSLKMARFELQKVSRNVDKIYEGFLKVGKAVIKPFTLLASLTKSISTNFGRTKTSSDKLNNSMSVGIKTLLKYGLGIRSTFVLFNKLRHAMVEGLQQMALREALVNQQLSSLYTSMIYMKAAVAAAVQPLLRALAPALVTISSLFERAAYAVGSFFATLTGQDFVYRAMRTNVDYATDIAGMTDDAADNLDDAADNAKDLKKQLSGLDKLNVLTTDDKDTKTKDKSGSANNALKPGYGWETSPLDKKAVKAAENLKKLLATLFDPIKKAWAKKGAAVMRAWKKALKAVWSLTKTIGRDFLKVWGEPKTQLIFENIFDIIKNIGLIIANLATNLEKAWKKNDNGLKIFRAIRDCLLSISTHVKNITDFLVKWSGYLNLTPLLTSIANALNDNVAPAVENIMSLVETLTIDVIDILGTWLIEKGIPDVITAIGNLIGAIGEIANAFEDAWKFAGTGKSILEKIRDNILDPITTKIKDLASYTKQWAGALNFTPLLGSINGWLGTIQGPMNTILTIAETLYEVVVLKFLKYMIEKGLPKLFDKLAEINLSIDWDVVNDRVKRLGEAFEKLMELAWESFVEILGDLGKAFGDIVTSDGFNKVVTIFENWVENTTPRELADMIETLALSFIMLKGALAIGDLILGAATGLNTILNLRNNLAGMGLIANPFPLVIEGATSLIAKLKVTIQTFKAVGKSFKLVAKINPFEGILAIIVGLIANIGGFANAMENGFTVANEAAMILGATLAVIGAFLLGVPASTAAAVAVVVVLIENLFVAITKYPEEFAEKINNLGDAFGKLPEKFGKFRKKLLEKVSHIGEDLGKKVGEWAANFMKGFEEFPKSFDKWYKTVDWQKLSENILNGLLFIFTLHERVMVLVLEAVYNFFKSFVKGFCEAFDMHSPSKKMEPYGKYILEGILNGIISAISGIGSWVVKHIFKPISNGIKSAFKKISEFKNAGKKAVSAIKSGMKSTMNNAKSWLMKNIVNPIKKGVSSGIEKAKEFKESGAKTVSDIKKGISSKWSKEKSKIQKVWSSIVSGAKKLLGKNKLKSTGSNLILGLKSGVDTGWKTLSIRLSSIWKSIKRSAKRKITSNSLYNTGRNLISGLYRGIVKKYNAVKSKVSEIYGYFISSAQSVFQEHSPSKVFMKIGEYIMEGLYIGIENESSDAKNAFNDIMPDTDYVSNFSESFTSILARMSQDAVSIIDSMIVSINDSMSKLESLDSLYSMSDRLAKISDMKLPKVAEGMSLPSSSSFKISSTDDKESIDFSKLSSIIKEAMIDALSDTSLQTEASNDDIIIQIDGKNVFNAVRTQNDTYKKRTGGVSAFA